MNRKIVSRIELNFYNAMNLKSLGFSIPLSLILVPSLSLGIGFSFKQWSIKQPKSTFVLSESPFWPKLPVSSASFGAQRIMVSNGSLVTNLFL